MKCAAPFFLGSLEAQSDGVLKTISSGVSAGAMVSLSAPVSQPLTFESMRICRMAFSTSKLVMSDLLTSLPPRYWKARTACSPSDATVKRLEYAVPAVPAGGFASEARCVSTRAHCPASRT